MIETTMEAYAEEMEQAIGEVRRLAEFTQNCEMSKVIKQKGNDLNMKL